MRVITEQELLSTVLERYQQQYKKGDVWKTGYARFDPETNYNKLCQLSPLTKKGVEEIMGGQSWTSILCHQCTNYVEKAIIFFEGGDEESRICGACLNRAAAILAHAR